MDTFTCPRCTGVLKEEVWENVTEQDNGDILVDTNFIYKCQSPTCSYMRRKNDDYNKVDEDDLVNLSRPNIFQFATSELSQDAFLCWFLSWGEQSLSLREKGLHEAATEFIAIIFNEYGIPVPVVKRLKIIRQFKFLDILVIINDTYAILIEDKTYSKNHSNQLVRYRKSIERAFPDFIQLPVYYKIADQSNYRAVQDAGYLPFTRKMMLNILRKGIQQGINNAIFSDYYNHLQMYEDEVNAFWRTPVASWNAQAWQGFYQEIQKK